MICRFVWPSPQLQYSTQKNIGVCFGALSPNILCNQCWDTSNFNKNKSDYEHNIHVQIIGIPKHKLPQNHPRHSPTIMTILNEISEARVKAIFIQQTNEVPKLKRSTKENLYFRWIFLKMKMWRQTENWMIIARS